MPVTFTLKDVDNRVQALNRFVDMFLTDEGWENETLEEKVSEEYGLPTICYPTQTLFNVLNMLDLESNEPETYAVMQALTSQSKYVYVGTHSNSDCFAICLDRKDVLHIAEQLNKIDNEQHQVLKQVDISPEDGVPQTFIFTLRDHDGQIVSDLDFDVILDGFIPKLENKLNQQSTMRPS